MTEVNRTMFRYLVPIDDRAHAIPLSGSPVAVAFDFGGGWADSSVEFWAESAEGAPQVNRAFRVFGTGHPLPEGAKWRGTCPRTPQGLVFHLYELPCAPEIGEG
jgi:hypothetical protein